MLTVTFNDGSHIGWYIGGERISRGNGSIIGDPHSLSQVIRVLADGDELDHVIAKGLCDNNGKRVRSWYDKQARDLVARI